MRSIASAARAASPPLLSSLARARAQACVLVVDGEDAVAERQLSRHRQIHQPARGFHRDDLEMDGLAADDAAERDRRVIGLAVRSRGVDRDRDRRRNLQRAGHRDDVMGDAGRLQLGDRAFQQRVLDVVIEARLDDQRARAGNVGLVLQRCAPRVCHRLNPFREVVLMWSRALCRRRRPGSKPSLNAATSFPSAAPHSAPSDRPRY